MTTSPKGPGPRDDWRELAGMAAFLVFVVALMIALYRGLLHFD